MQPAVFLEPDDAALPCEPWRRKWTTAEYRRMQEVGILAPDTPVEWVAGDLILQGTGGERHRWTREEYYRMGDAGILGTEERVELIEGEVLKMSPQLPPHTVTISLVAGALSTAFGPGYYVRQQVPLELQGSVEPEPDAAVVPGSPRDYQDAHPTTALLVVEVSDTSLAFDQTKKAALYAAARILDYWIIDLVHHRVEIRRDPLQGAQGFNYQSVTSYGPGETLSPFAAPAAAVPVDDLLPRRRKDKKR